MPTHRPHYLDHQRITVHQGPLKSRQGHRPADWHIHVATSATLRVGPGATCTGPTTVTMSRMFRPASTPPTAAPAAAIYRLRQYHDLSYRELAHRIQRAGHNLDHANIYRIEHGAAYTSQSLAAIAAGLQVAVTDLFTDPRLAPLATLAPADRAEAEAKVSAYVADLLLAYRARAERR